MGSFDYLAGKAEYSELYAICNKIENESDKEQRAVLCRVALMNIIDSIYRNKGLKKPEMATMLELIDGNVVSSFFENDMLISAAHFIRKIGSNAEHKITVKKTNVKTAFNNLVYIVQYYHTKLEDPDNVVKLVLPQFMSEAETRKIYIDSYLEEAGWEVIEPNTSKVLPGGQVIACGTPIAAKACCEIPVTGMSSSSGIGFCDYVLYGRNGKPLAIVEAKKTSVNPSMGSYQVKEYGKCMEKAYGYVPVLYYTNGYEIYIIDGLYPARRVAAFHTIDDLEYMLQKRNRTDMKDLKVREDISGRPYQIMAVTNVCEHFNKNFRRSLLVMATGTGKTRVAISIVEVMMRNKWINKVLFLADRTSLVSQAASNFSKILPDLTLCVLSDKSKDFDPNAKVCLSTHQTMINFIDAEDKLFSIGRFDLIIVDEAHRSVFNKYGSIFTYFDSLLVGLTATPKDEVDASTYQLFNCENGEPDFAYTIEEAVKEKYLVPYTLENRKSKLLTEGTTYSKLNDADKAAVELVNEDDVSPEFKLRSVEFFKKYYNRNTCSVVLDELMNYGLKVDGNQVLGKTIIFAYNHTHAEMIVDVFKKEFPYDDDYCQLIDNKVKHADKLITEFESNDKFRIAVSVDMLDTGVDVPSVLNLVFFKPVKSKIKFVQMIGRGTRLCSNLIDGQDKTHFLIFDYCGNFEYFNMNPDGEAVTNSISLSQYIFSLKLDLLVELQSYKYQQDPVYVGYYNKIKNELFKKVTDIKKNSSSISVRMAMQYVDKYCDYERWTCIAPLEKKEMQAFLTNLIANDLDEDVRSLRFDIQVFQIELAVLTNGANGSANRQIKRVRLSSQNLLNKAASQPLVKKNIPLLKDVAGTEYWNNLNMDKLEKTREVVRDLLVYLKKEDRSVEIDEKDEIIAGKDIDTPLLDIRTYKEKVLDYLVANKNNETINKIKNLEQINADDLKELERILWQELGTEEEYKKTTKIDNLAAFIRSLVGIEQNVINEKFGEFLGNNMLNSQQQEFVKAIIDYVRENGDICVEDLLEVSPFDTYDLLTVFGANISIITKLVNEIHNSITAA